jgi:hypothetical protein
MFHVCLSKKRAICAYVNQERDYAKDVSWPILEELIDHYGLSDKVKLDNRGMVVRFLETGSTIKLYGADQPRYQRRMRGKQFDVVVVDESQDFIFSDLEHLTMRVLLPTLADRRGRLWMCGTPGDHENYFYEVAWQKQHKQWSVVHGEYLENPHTRAELRGQVNMLKRANPDIEDEPWFQREYKNQWVPDLRKAVVKLRPDLNYLYEWQREPDDRFCLGIDFGFSKEKGLGHSAYVLLTWNPDRYPFFIYLDGWQREKMEIHDHVTAINEYMLEYPNLRIVGDPSWFGGKDRPSSESFVEELQQIHGLPVEPAEKKDKRFHVERLNSEATCGWLKIYHAANPEHPEQSAVAKQWNKLVRLKDGSEGTPRHIHDAALYARRSAAPWAFRGEVQRRDPEEVKRQEMRQARFDTLAKRRGQRKRRTRR